MIFVPTSKAFIVNYGACKCTLLCIFSAITYFLFSQVLFFQTTNFSFSGAIFVLSFFQFVKLFRCAVSSVLFPRMMHLAQCDRCRADVLLPVGFSQRSFVALPLSGKPLRRYLFIRYTSNGGNGFRLPRLRVFKDLSYYLVERERFFFLVHQDTPIAIVTFHIRES